MAQEPEIPYGIPESQIPQTAPGLRDCIRYSIAEIKRSEKKIKQLTKLVDYCQTQLIIQGDAHVSEHFQVI